MTATLAEVRHERTVPPTADCRHARVLVLLEGWKGHKPVIFSRPEDECIPEYERSWRYDSLAAAWAAYAKWDGAGEPEGWNERPTPGFVTRRPHGTPECEFTIDRNREE
jgi:hypothetical protein